MAPARAAFVAKVKGDVDPLTLAIAPPATETAEERWEREQQEARARTISTQIDEALRAERMTMKRKGKPIKVLVLGQSESGKSTTIKSTSLLSFASAAPVTTVMIDVVLIHPQTSKSSMRTLLSSRNGGHGER